MDHEECCDNPNLCDRQRPEATKGRTPLQRLPAPPPPKPPLALEEPPAEHPLGKRYLSRALGN